MTQLPPPGWHPDPYHRFQVRYWNGELWTEHVATNGQQAVDPTANLPLPTISGQPSPAAALQAPAVQRSRVVGSTPPLAPKSRATKKIQKQVQKSGLVGFAAPEHDRLLTSETLVVNQKARLLRANAEYAIFDPEGDRIGTVREFGGFAHKATGLTSRRYEVVGTGGRVLMRLTAPMGIIKNSLIVTGAAGTTGEITQTKLGLFKKVSFNLEASGRVVGTLSADDWAAWNFRIDDAAGNEVARISKTWAGWAKERFTKADNYVVQIHRPLEEPLRSLVVAAALAVDTGLKESSTRGHKHGTRRYH